MTLGLSDEHVELHRVAARWLRTHATGAARSATEATEAVTALDGAIRALEWHQLDHPEAAVVLEETGRALLPGALLPTMAESYLARRAGAEPPPAPGALALGVGDVVATVGTSGCIRLDGTVGPIIGVAGAVLVGGVDAAGEEHWAIVGGHDAGVVVEERAGVDATRPLAILRLDAVGVMAERVLEGVTADAVLDEVAVLAAAEAAGVARWCVDTAAAYARTREQFGRPIGQFQAVKHRCADMLVAAELARGTAWDAARAHAAVEPGAALAISAAAAVALDAAVDCAKSCIQVLGGMGYTWEHDAHLYLRRALATRQLLGGSAWWRQRAATAALSGQRRSLTVGLPPEADRFRAEVRGVVDELATSDHADDRRRRLVEAGYLVPEWPAPWGRGAGAVEQLVITDELGRAGIRRPDLLVGMWVVPTLIAHGSREQQERWIGPTLVGDVSWCQLFSEPDAGSDLASLSTAARRVEGGWQLTGRKIWTSLAHVADRGICLARTGTADSRHLGITCFLVDMGAPGVEVRPLRELTGRPTFNEVVLTDVFVPDDGVVGAVGDGWRVGRTTLGNERVSMGRGSSLGKGIEGLLRLCDRLDLARDSRVLDQIGGLVTEAHALAVLGHRVATRAVAGAPPGPEASIRKLVSAEHDQRVEELGLALSGRDGALADGRAKGWVDGVLLTRCLTIAGGTSEIQRNVLAERLLDLPRDP